MPWIADPNLCKHGNSIAVCIPRSFLHRLGWLCGRKVILELNDDQTMLVVRQPIPSDYGPMGPAKVTRVESGVTSVTR